MPWTRADGWGCLVFACLLFTSHLAHGGDPATAEALFQAGRDAMKAGRIDEACEKFAASMEEDPSPGTLLNLGQCHEKQGKLATAWAEYKEARSLAKQRGETERVDVAEKLARDVEPRVAKLTIVAPELPGLEVSRNGKAVSRPSWGVAIPVDAGTYEIEAHAPQHAPWSEQIAIRDGERKTVTVPALAPMSGPAPEPAGPSPMPNGPDRAGGPSALLISGIVVGIVGVGGLVAGGVLTGLAASEKSEADEACPNLACSNEGFDMIESARGKAHGATASFIIGGVLAAVGITLITVDLATGNDTVAVACDFTGCGARWGGSF